MCKTCPAGKFSASGSAVCQSKDLACPEGFSSAGDQNCTTVDGIKACEIFCTCNDGCACSVGEDKGVPFTSLFNARTVDPNESNATKAALGHRDRYTSYLARRARDAKSRDMDCSAFQQDEEQA